jgi:hypothetical protein
MRRHSDTRHQYWTAADDSCRIARASHDVPDYDRATELEALGGRIAELPPGPWPSRAK